MGSAHPSATMESTMTPAATSAFVRDAMLPYRKTSILPSREASSPTSTLFARADSLSARSTASIKNILVRSVSGTNSARSYARPAGNTTAFDASSSTLKMMALAENMTTS